MPTARASRRGFRRSRRWPPGGYQRVNFALAATAAEAFLGRAPSRDALAAAAAQTRVAGRLDVSTSAR